tara:strand:+ start:251 stop:673 length:423 start_codon:yes stop_codon:yes gene_type:complete
MSHITVDREGKTYHVPLATVQDVIDLMDSTYSKRREELLVDLKAVEASPTEKLQALAELRERKGLTTDLMREAFTLDGACAIIQHVAKPDDHNALIDVAPDKVVELALLVLGFTLDETDESKEGSDVDPPKGDETSTTKQ